MLNGRSYFEFWLRHPHSSTSMLLQHVSLRDISSVLKVGAKENKDFSLEKGTYTSLYNINSTTKTFRYSWNTHFTLFSQFLQLEVIIKKVFQHVSNIFLQSHLKGIIKLQIPSLLEKVKYPHLQVVSKMRMKNSSL